MPNLKMVPCHNSLSQSLDFNFERVLTEDFQDGGYREEAESMPPKVKSWRDAGDTPCRQGHREEAKL
jgi:hypothetical protein